MVKIRKPIVVLILTILTISVLTNIYFYRQLTDQNTVIKVVDGDSIDLADGRRIRLLGIDAPERNRCMYEEARNRLKQMVENRRLRMENTVTDDYGRSLANVFVGTTFVNKIMLEEGLARFLYVKSPYYDELKSAFTKAKTEHIGVFSPICSSPENISCLIKGNIREGEKIYHLPNCKNYKQVEMQEAFGGMWFCSESEARKAGFRKVEGCK